MGQSGFGVQGRQVVQVQGVLPLFLAGVRRYDVPPVALPSIDLRRIGPLAPVQGVPAEAREQVPLAGTRVRSSVSTARCWSQTV